MKKAKQKRKREQYIKALVRSRFILQIGSWENEVRSVAMMPASCPGLPMQLLAL